MSLFITPTDKKVGRHEQEEASDELRLGGSVREGSEKQNLSLFKVLNCQVPTLQFTQAQLGMGHA